MPQDLTIFRPVRHDIDALEETWADAAFGNASFGVRGDAASAISWDDARFLAGLVRKADGHLEWWEENDRIELRPPPGRIDKWLFTPWCCQISIPWEIDGVGHRAFVAAVTPAVRALYREGYYVAEDSLMRIVRPDFG